MLLEPLSRFHFFSDCAIIHMATSYLTYLSTPPKDVYGHHSYTSMGQTNWEDSNLTIANLENGMILLFRLSSGFFPLREYSPAHQER